MNLTEHASQTLRARKVLPRGRNIVVAVSGGVDSMVLLRVLHELASARGWKLAVAHFNHQLRGRSSDADERLVQAAAKSLGLPFFRDGEDVRAHAGKRKLSLEMAARELRHRFLADTARKFKAGHIALAHHADDQVELFFLRLLRGSGEGLGGMRWQSPSPADANIRLVRPLLDVIKKDLETYARRQRIQFRHDASNASPDHLRNRVRHELLPLLSKKFQPALNKVVLRTMDILAAEGEALATQVPRVPRLSSARFHRLPLALRRRWLQQQLLALRVLPTFELVERLREKPEAPCSLGPWAEVLLRGGEVCLRRRSAARRKSQVSKASLVVVLGRRRQGNLDFSGRKISWKIERMDEFFCPKPGQGAEYFDADQIGGRMIFRHWQPGDRFQPIGMSVAVKLQDLFVNGKIPRQERGRRVVATKDDGAIFWVQGLRIGEVCKLGPATRRKLTLRWE